MSFWPRLFGWLCHQSNAKCINCWRGTYEPAAGLRIAKSEVASNCPNVPQPLTFCTRQKVEQKIDGEWHFLIKLSPHVTKFRYIFIILPLTFLLRTHFSPPQPHEDVFGNIECRMFVPMQYWIFNSPPPIRMNVQGRITISWHVRWVSQCVDSFSFFFPPAFPTMLTTFVP